MFHSALATAIIVADISQHSRKPVHVIQHARTQQPVQLMLKLQNDKKPLFISAYFTYTITVYSDCMFTRLDYYCWSYISLCEFVVLSGESLTSALFEFHKHCLLHSSSLLLLTSTICCAVSLSYYWLKEKASFQVCHTETSSALWLPHFLFGLLGFRRESEEVFADLIELSIMGFK